MKEEKLISVDEFCIHHHVEFSYMSNLREFGLIEIVTKNKVDYISEHQFEKIERILRLNQDLEINLEGIDAIQHLLQQVNAMQAEINRLTNRLRLYEDL
ncbi:MAG: MerR family transcriptional regulator [Flavobacterium sp.]|nr:MerR family transcriptional regulator [Pedobacter sp.]